MPTKERQADVAGRTAGRVLRTVADELREARLAAGVTQKLVATRGGMSRAELSRIERSAAPWLTIDHLCRLSAALGLDPSVRLYPVASPLRDRAHLQLLDRLRVRLHASLRWQTEVPLPLSGDRRAWDAMIQGARWRVAVEAETRLRDVQALMRRVALKRRDGAVDTVVLLVADTRSNRAALRAAGPLPDFPADPASLLAALVKGRQPAASGVIRL